MPSDARELIGLVTVLLALVLAVVYIAGPGRWILGPIDRAAHARGAPVRWSIADLLCLFWTFQLPLALVIQIDRDDAAGYFPLALLMVWIVAPLVWFVCTRTLSRAGVTRVRHRVIFLAGVLPVVYYGMFLLLGMAALSAASFLLGEPPQLITYRGMARVSVFLVISLAASGWFTRRMVAAVHDTAEDA